MLVKGLKLIFLLFTTVLLSSCNRKLCSSNSFYSVYENLYLGKDTSNNNIIEDLEIKKSVFSRLCIPNNYKKVLLVESQNSTNSFFSNGLIYVYDDSTTYYYELAKGKIKCGEGTNKNIQLDNLLKKVKNNFEIEGQEIKRYNEKENLRDAPFVRLTLFATESEEKIKSISFNFVEFPN